MNIVMLVKDRPRLTEQALDSLRANTTGPYNLTIVDDLSENFSTREIINREKERGAAVLLNMSSKGIIGQARNLGIFWSREYFGEDKDGLLYLADNDSYFTYGWDVPVRTALEMFRHPCIVGGQNHPYHQPVSDIDFECVRLKGYLALAGTSWCMRWSTWHKFGPFVHSAPGPCQSEDWEFTQRLKKAGGTLWAVWPHVVYDCGITQTGGTMSPGHDAKPRAEGVIYE